jgi:hypothetical protein
MNSLDDEDSRLDRILRSRFRFKWPYSVTLSNEVYNAHEDEITEWVRSNDRQGNINVYRSSSNNGTVKVYFDNQDDQFEFSLRY